MPGHGGAPVGGGSLSKEVSWHIYDSNGKYVVELTQKNLKTIVPKYLGECYESLADEFKENGLGVFFDKKFLEKLKELEASC